METNIPHLMEKQEEVELMTLIGSWGTSLYIKKSLLSQ